jgi:signal transduction histidine kinase
VSRELHDELGQRLTSAALFAKALEDEVPGPQAERLRGLRLLIEGSFASTRSLVWSLRPVELDDSGLGPVLDRFAEDLQARHGVRVDVHTIGLDRRLPPEVETATYRVTQEAVNNAVRHGCPESISIVVTRHARKLQAVIEDDGQGFDVAAVTQGRSPSGRLGLIGMQERAHAVGGRLAVDSSPGLGTTVRLEVQVT